MSKGKKPPQSRLKRDPVLDLFFAKRNYRLAIGVIKTERKYSQAKVLLPKLGSANSHADLRNALIGTVVTEKWDDVLVSPILPKSSDWIQEFGWLSHGFIRESERLNSFIKLRRAFGRFYLLGDYPAAEDILSELRAKHGVSLWLAEREFMLLQAKDGFVAHKARLSAIQEQIANSLVGYLVTTASDRLEPHITHEAFFNSSQQVLTKLRNDGHHQFASWIELHVSPWSFNWMGDRQELLRNCFGTPLVDRYDRALKIMSCFSSEEMSDSEPATIRNILLDLQNVIQDRQIDHLLTAFASEPTEFDEATDAYLDALDYFVEGRYEQCVGAAGDLLNEDPTCFQFYWLLAQAMACVEEQKKPALAEGSQAQQILETLCKIAENKTAVNVPLLDLSLFSLSLGDNHLGISLWQFAEFETQHLRCRHAAMQASIQNKIDYFDASFSCGLSAHHLSDTTFVKNYGRHIAIRLARFENGCEKDDIVDIDDRVATPFKVLARARRSAAMMRHHDVITELQNMPSGAMKETRAAKFLAAAVAPLEFEALVGLDHAVDAASSIIRSYIENRNVLRHIPFETLIEGGKSGRWLALRRVVAWPILVFLNNGSEQDIYEAVDDLLIEHGCVSPMAIVDGTIPCSEPELRIILRDVLIPSVIARGALWNKTAEQRRTMRKQMLQKLYAISVEDQALVVEQLSRIEQVQLLETAYRHVEGPKFNLNFVDVNRRLPIMLDGVFARYVEHREYEDSGGTLATESEFLDLAKDGVNAKPAADKKGVTSEFLLRQMLTFTYINYLVDTSNGINASLGTRIRHGSLENQLTRVFGSYSLLAVRTVDGSFRCDSSLSARLAGCAIDVRTTLESEYFKFTAQTADLIDDLIASQLRIRIPEFVMTFVEREQKKELRANVGLLDFSGLFTAQSIAHFRDARFSSLKAFLAETERAFAGIAHLAFKNVQKYFEREVAELIGGALSDLDAIVQATLPEGSLRGTLRAGILSAKGEFAQDLKIVVNWFSVSNQSAVGVGSLEEVISMATKVVNFASNGKLGSVSKVEFEDEKWDAEKGMLMYEVFSILLRNVVQHSGTLANQSVQCSHRISTNERELVLRNRVADDTLLNAAVGRAVESIARPFDEWALGTSPGGTGFSRIRKLLKQAGFGECEIFVGSDDEIRAFEVRLIYR